MYQFVTAPIYYDNSLRCYRYTGLKLSLLLHQAHRKIFLKNIKVYSG